MKQTNTQISLGIMQIWSRMKSNIEHMAEENGLTLAQVFVLHNLNKKDSILMGTLAKRLHCDASNITSLVDRLENRSFIERHDVAGDRRAKRLTIKYEGKALIESMYLRLHINTGLDTLTKNELETLDIIVQKMNVAEKA